MLGAHQGIDKVQRTLEDHANRPKGTTESLGPREAETTSDRRRCDAKPWAFVTSLSALQ